jgi:hypothetical protein
MAEHFLKLPNACAPVKHVGSVRMPEHVRGYATKSGSGLQRATHILNGPVFVRSIVMQEQRNVEILIFHPR